MVRAGSNLSCSEVPVEADPQNPRPIVADANVPLVSFVAATSRQELIPQAPMRFSPFSVFCGELIGRG